MIHVEGLAKLYGDLVALDDVSFEASPGEVIGVLGLNGAGKTTLLRILAGELTPSGGTVRVGGVDLVARPRELRARVGYLAEHAPVYADMRLREFLAYLGRLRGVSRADLPSRVSAVAERLHLGEQLGRVIGELSMGFRKRVGIAQALLHDPPVLLLDEPISALDPAEIVGMRRLIRSLGGERTVLVSSHILSEVHETCDRLLVLKDGRLVAQGREADLSRPFGAGARVALLVRGTAELVTSALPDGVAVERSEPVGGGLMALTLVLDEDRREELVAALVMAGVGVRSVAQERSDLEDLFLSTVAEVAP